MHVQYLRVVTVALHRLGSDERPDAGAGGVGAIEPGIDPAEVPEPKVAAREEGGYVHFRAGREPRQHARDERRSAACAGGQQDDANHRSHQKCHRHARRKETIHQHARADPSDDQRRRNQRLGLRRPHWLDIAHHQHGYQVQDQALHCHADQQKRRKHQPELSLAQGLGQREARLHHCHG